MNIFFFIFKQNRLQQRDKTWKMQSFLLSAIHSHLYIQIQRFTYGVLQQVLYWHRCTDIYVHTSEGQISITAFVGESQQFRYFRLSSWDIIIDLWIKPCFKFPFVVLLISSCYSYVSCTNWTHMSKVTWLSKSVRTCNIWRHPVCWTSKN